QWGDFFILGKPAGWQWFAIQIDDGGSLMITEARGIDGEITDTYGTYMSPEGEVTSLRGDTDGIQLTTTSEWTSPTTNATYPAGWALEIDSLDLNLALKPVLNDQEIQGGLPAASTYWEGKVRATGQQNGQQITANAYVELSGYVDPEPIEWLQR
ncbi:MAG: lipocalin family protein, partial [Dehalococcoidia bacterium]